jgi:hypothetical protein
MKLHHWDLKSEVKCKLQSQVSQLLDIRVTISHGDTNVSTQHHAFVSYKRIYASSQTPENMSQAGTVTVTE